MLIESRAIANDPPREMDICIIGAGIAGLVLARGLEGRGLSVWLFESGGSKFDSRMQNLNAGQSNQQDYPFTQSRVRGFGGTSSSWAGACIPLDPFDFEPRSWLSNSGWPISYGDLHTYYDKAKADFGIGCTSEFQSKLDRSPLNQGDLEAKTVAYSAPLNLGKRYRNLISSSTEIHCVLNATATEIIPTPDGKRVDRVELATTDGARFFVSPKAVVVSAGGIENARLLLASNSVQSAGLGNSYDVVGRYHMEHPIRTAGVLPIGAQYRSFLPFTNRSRLTTADLQGTFGLTRAARAREKVLDLHLRCYRFNVLEDTGQVRQAKQAVHEFGKNQSLASVKKVAGALHPTTCRYLGWHAKNKLWKYSHFDHIRMTAFVEQEPLAENRITLSHELDGLGSPLPYLKLRESARMYEGIQRSMSAIGRALRTAGYPGLRYDEQTLAHLDQYNDYGLHHMGSTRMASNPRFGVVDKHCCVFGMNNLFVAGSSVFATGGAANPTWTITALALRIADEVTKRMDSYE